MDESTLENITLDVPNADTSQDRIHSTLLLTFYICVVIVGIPGNCLIIRVFWGKPLKSSTCVLIMGLAATDLVVCLLKIWDIALQSFSLAGLGTEHLAYSSTAVVYTANTMSVCITAVIALDRYDCVCCSNRRLMTACRAKKSLLASVAASVMINLPLYIKLSIGNTRSSTPLRVVHYVFELTTYTVALGMIAVCYTKVFLTIRKHVRLGVASERRHRRVGVAVLTVSSRVVMGETLGASSRQFQPSLVPIATVSDLTDDKENKTGGNSQLTVPPRSRTDDRAPRRVQSTAPSLQRRTTIMLFVTTVVFILAWLPYWIQVLLDIIGETSPILGALLKILYLNSAVNPFIYGLANRRFRKDCKDVFSRK